MSQINFFERREFSEIVGVAFQFVKQNFLHYFINILLLNIPLVLFLVFIVQFLIKNISNIVGVSTLGGIGAIFGFLLLIFSLFFLWYSYISAIGFNYYLLYIEKGTKNFSISDLFNASLRSLFPLLIANLVLGLLILVLGIVFVSLLSTLMSFLGGFAKNFLISSIIMIVAVFYGVKLSFYPIIVVREKLGIFKAISRSFKLVQGNWWQTFGLLAVMTIISYLISYFIGLVVSIFGIQTFDFLAFASKEVPQIDFFALIVFVFLQIVTSVFANMFIQTTLFAQYGNLIEEKEGVDLRTKAEQIGKTTDNTNDEEDF